MSDGLPSSDRPDAPGPAPRPRTNRPRLIGLTGTNGAGKGVAAAFFRDRGFEYHSLSDVIREELAARGEEPSRDNLIRTGNELRERFGPDVLARRVLDAVGDRPAVVDSIRNPAEVARLRERGGFVLLAIDAPVEVRFRRACRRGRDESARTLEEFRRKEDEEMRGSETRQRLEATMALADRRIVNDGSFRAFRRKLEEVLA